MNKVNLLISLCFIFLSASCGDASNEQKRERSILYANQLLTERKCSEALQVLDTGGFQGTDAKYTAVRASAQACSGNFDEISFFRRDLDTLTAVTSANFFYLLTNFYNATNTPLSDEYESLEDAMNTLLYVGNESSHQDRINAYGEDHADAIGAQALYIIMAQLGRYTRFFGNVGLNAGTTNLEKGQGSGTNTCLADYTTTAAQTALTAMLGTSPTNPCAVATNGHALMSSTGADRVSYMCNGIVMLNNFFDLVANVDFTGNNTNGLQALAAVSTSECHSFLGLTAPVCNVRSQSECEALAVADLETYMVLYFESLMGDVP